MPALRKSLHPDIVGRLHGLELRARQMAAGFISGMHRSPFRGFSVEFADYREYVPGDDLRYIDWRIVGRTDRFYIKQYEEETNLRCNFLVDASASMAYSGSNAARSPDGKPLSKLDYACTLAASLAYVLVRQQDAAGLVLFDSAIRTHLHSNGGRAHLANLVSLLDAAAPSGASDVRALFHRLAEELRHRSMVVLISDLLADPADVLSGLEHICHAGHELILLHLLDEDEWNLPFIENTLFEGLEDNLRLIADPQSLQASYRAVVRDFSARVRAVCLKHRGDYVAINTREPPDGVLTGYLARRGGLSQRTRG